MPYKDKTGPEGKGPYTGRRRFEGYSREELKAVKKELERLLLTKTAGLSKAVQKALKYKGPISEKLFLRGEAHAKGRLAAKLIAKGDATGASKAAMEGVTARFRGRKLLKG